MDLHQIGQISLTVDDIDKAESFYEDVLGLKKLYRFGDLLFFDCGGIRLYITKPEDDSFSPSSSILYFRTTDIGRIAKELTTNDVLFLSEPHLIAEMSDHDLWMAFFKDPAGNTLALMHEAEKGYKPKKT